MVSVMNWYIVPQSSFRQLMRSLKTSHCEYRVWLTPPKVYSFDPMINQMYLNALILLEHLNGGSLFFAWWSPVTRYLPQSMHTLLWSKWHPASSSKPIVSASANTTRLDFLAWLVDTATVEMAVGGSSLLLSRPSAISQKASTCFRSCKVYQSFKRDGTDCQHALWPAQGWKGILFKRRVGLYFHAYA